MKKLHIFSKILLTTVIILSISECKTAPVSDKLTISFAKYVLPNGRQLILHADHSDPIISYAIMYHVGSSREGPGKTGFSHLFALLRFGGSGTVADG